MKIRSELGSLGKEVPLKHDGVAKAEIDISFDTPYRSLGEIGMLHKGDIVYLPNGDRIKVSRENVINANSFDFLQFEGENLDDPEGKDVGYCFNINHVVKIDPIRGQTYTLNEKELEHARQMEPLIRQNFEECMEDDEDKQPMEKLTSKELEMPE